MADAQEQKRFLENQGEKPRRQKKPKWTRETPKRRKGVNRTSDKQRERTAFLHGIKAERMLRPIPVYGGEEAPTSWKCETCWSIFHTFEDAWEALTVSHIEPRNDTASRYERRREPDFRGDAPSNILLECVSCNLKREPNPEFGRAS